MADSVPDFLFIATADGRRDYVNRHFSDYTGLPAGAAKGRAWIDVLHPEDRERVLEAWRRATATGRPLQEEARELGANGCYRWFVTYCRPMGDGEGRIVKWFGTTTDIDDLKRAEDALQRSDERARAILASISDNYFTLDRDWRFVDLNAQAASWLCRSPDDLLGKAIWDVYPEARGTLVERYFSDVMASRHSAHFEFFSILRPGRWTAVHAYPIAEGLSAFCHDVTERKATEQTLHATRELLQSTIDALSTRIAILNRQGVIIAVNAAWHRFNDANDLQGANCRIGRNYAEACARAATENEYAAQIAAGLASLLEGRSGGFRLEYPCSSHGLSRQWFQLRITRFGEGEACRLVVAHEDVTEIKRAEETLRDLTGHLLQAQDQERRRIARELHDSTVQHLATAKLVIARLRGASPSADSKAQDAITEVRALVDQSLQELRTLSYLLHPPLLDDLGLSATLQWYVEGFTKRSGISVKLSTPRDLKRLPSDIEGALFRVVQESLTNIYRHSGSTTANIRLAAHADRIVLEIRDRGIGMAQAAPCSPGVGIPGMKFRLQQLNGTLDIQSSPRGTRVTAIVPAFA